MFPVLFTVPRVAGWLAHWLELLDDPETRIYRPRQIYAGEGRRSVPEIGLRFPADVNLHGESVRSDPEAAKRRETAGALRVTSPPQCTYAHPGPKQH